MGLGSVGMKSIGHDGSNQASRPGSIRSRLFILALQRIGVVIYTSPHHEAGSLRWADSARGYGFPIARNLRDLLVGDDVKL